VDAIISKAKTLGESPIIMESVIKLNRDQPLRMIELLKKRIDIKGKKVCVLGLTFKPGTDDIREAPSTVIVDRLLKEGAAVNAYDPKAMMKFRDRYPQISYFKSVREALKNADACLILTEWEEFKSLNERDFNTMRNRIIIEGRKVLNPKNVSKFEGVCW